MMKHISALLILLMMGVGGCHKNDKPAPGAKLQVITTLFPVYDFARVIGGDRVEARLLLPPGVEPHNFEPKPEDVARLSKADLFIFTNRYMEPWAEGMLKGAENPRLVVVNASTGATLIPAGGAHQHDGHEEAAKFDPHIWLDIANAMKMVENIRDGFIRKDPAGSAYYGANAAAYLERLAALDRKFRDGLSECSQHVFLHGGHYAFSYLAKRYSLQYVSAYALSPNAEPTPRKIMELVDLMRKNSLKAIFYEELVSPRMAETVARETGATLLKLHGIHNISRDDLVAGVTYLSLMESNLDSLRRGLECR